MIEILLPWQHRYTYVTLPFEDVHFVALEIMLPLKQRRTTMTVLPDGLHGYQATCSVSCAEIIASGASCTGKAVFPLKLCNLFEVFMEKTW